MSDIPNVDEQPATKGTEGNAISASAQALRIQHTAFELTERLRKDIRSSRTKSERVELASALRAAVQAFDTAAERRRVLLGHGLPRAVDSVPKGNAKRRLDANAAANVTFEEQPSKAA